ncbi:MAG: DUF6978 family protein [Gemmatimonadota bacterium]
MAVSGAGHSSRSPIRGAPRRCCVTRCKRRPSATFSLDRYSSCPHWEIELTEIALTQTEADALLAMEKHRVDETTYDYPSLGGALRIPLQSADKREAFMLDITRSQINLVKGTYQNRGRGVVILARLDFGGAPHRNPNGDEIQCPHLHLYREGYGDRWAVALPVSQFTDPTNPSRLLTEFMRFVNIVSAPELRSDLFT